MASDSKRKVFLIVSSDPDRLEQMSELVSQYYPHPIIYDANNRSIALAKVRNAPVDIIITDDLSKNMDSIGLVEDVLALDKEKKTAIMIVGHPPEEEKFLDEIVISRISFIDAEIQDNEFLGALTKALNYTAAANTTHFNLKYLAPGELLIREGEEAKYLYILKSGELQAYLIKNGDRNILGTITSGEFVGEMAYINKEKRSAFIEATAPSELIEIPFGLVEKIIYSRPSWSKALIQTLSKRLKNVNKLIVN